jgi:outer membrane protein assembly factor BamB
VTGCSGGSGSDSATTTVAEPAPARTVPDTLLPPERKTYVYVVDGDVNRHIEGASVKIGPDVGITGRAGATAFLMRRGASWNVHLDAPGYSERTLPVTFNHRQITLRIYKPQSQWPMYGVTPRRTQAQTTIRLRPPFRVIWSRGLGSLLEFPAVVKDGLAYIANYRGSVFALSMRYGTVVWRTDTSGKMAASPAVAGRELVVHGMDGNIWIFDRFNGRLKWRYAVGSPVESSPVVRGGVDYFGSWNGRVYALDLHRHTLRWSYVSGSKITSSASVLARTVYIGDYGGRVLALDIATGRPRWSASVNGRIYGTPAVAGGSVFVPSSTGNSLTAFSTSGHYRWRVTAGRYVYSSPAVWAGRVYFGSHDGYLRCVSARTGGTLWRSYVGRPISGAPTVVAGVVYYASIRGRIYGADARTGRLLYTFPDGQYVPVSGNAGRLLLHGYSRLYAVIPKA